MCLDVNDANGLGPPTNLKPSASEVNQTLRSCHDREAHIRLCCAFATARCNSPTQRRMRTQRATRVKRPACAASRDLDPP